MIYVDDNATGTNNGHSGPTRMLFVQEDLADADLAKEPVEIRFAQGTYKPNQSLGAAPEFDWRTAIFLGAGWDFADETENGTEDIWWIDEGKDYPRLWWELIPEN